MKRVVILLLSMFARINYAELGDIMLLPTDAPITITLAEAAHQAIEKSSIIKKARQAIVIAQSDTLQSASKILPKISLKASHEAVKKAEEPTELAQGGLSVSLPLFDAKSLIDVRARRETVVSLEEKFDDAKNALVNEIGSLYFDALIALAAKENAQSEHELFQKQLLVFERQAKHFNVRSLTLSRVQYLAHKTLTDSILREQEFQKAMGELGKKFGMRQFFLVTPFEIMSPHLAKDNDALVALSQDAFDLKALKREMEAANISLAAEKFDWLPKVNASIDGGFQSSFNERVLSAHPSFQTKWMINFELPLFSGGSQFAAIKNKSAQKVLAELGVAAKIGEKLLTINGLKKQIDDFLKMKNSAALAFDAATRAQDAAYRLLEKGEITDYGRDIVDAVTNYFSAKNQLTYATFKLEAAKLRLLHVIGRSQEIL